MENAPFRILLADDDEGDQLLFKEAMGALDLIYTMHTVNNGMQLMDYLRAEKTILPHLIFLDLNMPRKNGLECLKEIRSDQKFKTIAIAVYSTSVAEKDIDEAFHSGANVYIKKPNNFTILKQLLCKAVKAAHIQQELSTNRENFLLVI
jgi:CheY-like chemotaxis protein